VTDCAPPAKYDQRLARQVVRPLARLGIHPNYVTTAGLICSLFCGWLLAQGGTAMHMGAGLFMLAAFIDHLDGELARMSAKCSRLGALYDDASSLVTYLALFIGAGIGLPANGILGTMAPLAGVVAGVSVAAIFGVVMRLDARLGRDKTFTRQQFFPGFEIEDMMYLAGPITWIGGLEYLLLAASIGAPIFLVFSLLMARRKLPAPAGRAA